MDLFFKKLGEGQAIIILHGVFGSADNWLTIQKTIAEQGFCVYAIDARNHGRSPHDDVFTYDIMATDLREFIEQQDIENPIIIGHSMGGKVTMQFAMNYPNIAQKYVVVDIAPRFYPVHHDHILRGLNAISVANLQNRNEAENILSQYEPHAGTRQFLLKNLYRNEAGGFAWRFNLAVLTKEIYNIGPEPSNQQIVDTPTLFLRGSESGYVDEEDFVTIRQIFRDARIETIEGAGHWVQADKPQEFVEAVVRFIVN